MISAQIKRALLAKIIAILEEAIPEQKQRIIDAQGKMNGRSWEPLKPSTIKRKQALGVADPEKPMYRTGALYESFETSADMSGDSSAEISLENDTPYIEYQDNSRPIMAFTQQDLEELVAVIRAKLLH